LYSENVSKGDQTSLEFELGQIGANYEYTKCFLDSPKLFTASFKLLGNL